MFAAFNLRQRFMTFMLKINAKNAIILNSYLLICWLIIKLCCHMKHACLLSLKLLLHIKHLKHHTPFFSHSFPISVKLKCFLPVQPFYLLFLQRDSHLLHQRIHHQQDLKVHLYSFYSLLIIL